jgi:hypothetical protein
MQDLLQLLHNPALFWLLGVYFVFMALTDALPAPTAASREGYRFLYVFMHGMSANLRRAAAVFHLPGADTPQP